MVFRLSTARSSVVCLVVLTYFILAPAVSPTMADHPHSETKEYIGPGAGASVNSVSLSPGCNSPGAAGLAFCAPSHGGYVEVHLEVDDASGLPMPLYVEVYDGQELLRSMVFCEEETTALVDTTGADEVHVHVGSSIKVHAWAQMEDFPWSWSFKWSAHVMACVPMAGTGTVTATWFS